MGMGRGCGRNEADEVAVLSRTSGGFTPILQIPRTHLTLCPSQPQILYRHQVGDYDFRHRQRTLQFEGLVPNLQNRRGNGVGE
jgi:hypothetical protein